MSESFERVPAISGSVTVSENRGAIFIIIDRTTPEIEQGVAMVEAPNRKRLAELVAGTEYMVIPAAAVPDAETIASLRRLLEITKYAQAVLFLEGDFGHRTTETAHLTDLLDAETLVEDWARIDALIKETP